jgi:hypothetical protein
MCPSLAALQCGQLQPPPPELIPLLPTEADFAAWRVGMTKKVRADMG